MSALIGILFGMLRHLLRMFGMNRHFLKYNTAPFAAQPYPVRIFLYYYHEEGAKDFAFRSRRIFAASSGNVTAGTPRFQLSAFYTNAGLKGRMAGSLFERGQNEFFSISSPLFFRIFQGSSWNCRRSWRGEKPEWTNASRYVMSRARGSDTGRLQTARAALHPLRLRGQAGRSPAVRPRRSADICKGLVQANIRRE